MNFYDLNDYQKSILETIKKICTEVVQPRTAEMDETGEFPWDIVKVLGGAGFFASAIPEQYGGTGIDNTTLCIINEEFSKTNPFCANVTGAHSYCARGILYGGTEEQKSKILTKMTDESGMGAFSITEPEAGSDVKSIKTKAILNGDSFVINGRKCFCTNARVASYYLVFASTEVNNNNVGISAFLIENGMQGLSFGKEENKLGMRAQATADVILEDVLVSPENVIGKIGGGVEIAKKVLNHARLDAASVALGLAEGAFLFARDYAKTRVQFKKPIAAFQAIQSMLADMAIKIEASKALIYKTAGLMDNNLANNNEISKLVSMAKCFTSDMAMEVTINAIQVLGGYGYMKDYPVERMMRDAKLWQIGDGTNQIQRIVIAHHILSD